MQLLERRRLPWILAPLLALGVLAASLPLRAGAQSLSVSTASLPNGELTAGYSQTLIATSGTAPYTWSITAGSLPAGLTLAPATGEITGTPTTTGTTEFTAMVTDSATLTASTAVAVLSITVNAAVTVTTTSLTAGELGVAYLQPLAVSNGVTPYLWSISAGALPGGPVDRSGIRPD